MEKTLSKYKIGLLVLMLFAVALAVLVLIQAGSTKTDTNTNNSASNIADTLNNYVDSNNMIPATLAKAGVKNVPSTISYQKLSDNSYKFCVTYKGSSSGFDASGVASDLVTGSLSSDFGSSSGSTELNIDSTYHKGVNCQTVQPSYITPITPQSCIGVGTLCQSNTTPTTTLCDFGPAETSGCSLRCSTSNSGTASPKLLDVDGTLTNVTGNGNTTVLTVKDSKNVTYTVSVTSSTSYYDSSCNSFDPTNLQSGDEVRVAYPSAVNNHVVASEIDDLSW
jgi:hypothetical protein